MEIPVQLTNLKELFSELADSRQARGERHELVDILVIMLLAMSCGADNGEDIVGIA
ncbi:MAG: transposase family protein [Myxococcota bacterium]